MGSFKFQMKDGEPSRASTNEFDIDEVDRQIEQIIQHMPKDLPVILIQNSEVLEQKESA